MHIYEAARQRGKTETLVEWVRKAPNRCIVVFCESERDRLVRQYGLTHDQVFHWNSNVPRQRNLEVGIDNLDLVLQNVYGDVKIATLTKDEWRIDA